MIKRIYSLKDIAMESHTSIMINDLPITITCLNIDPILLSMSPHVDSDFYPLSTVIRIIADVNDLNSVLNKNKKETYNFTCKQFGLADRVYQTEDPNEPKILVHVMDEPDENGYSKAIKILFYRPFIKMQIRTQLDAVLKSNEVALLGYHLLDGKIPDNYVLYSSHLFDAKIELQISEMDFLKNLLMRLMISFDMPIHTQCTKESSYSIVLTDQNKISC
jgi:hypothetical protein